MSKQGKGEAQSETCGNGGRGLSTDDQEMTTNDYQSELVQVPSDAANLRRKLLVRVPTKSLIVDVFMAPTRIYRGRTR